ncbi:Nup54 domain-containing protein [Mycena venus]|uniref:Nup54 domain-containing protein n=1 Tax=Mycena venus TaxID=2733690 RepID=A0A8H7CM60_9AGAR|nr:Nup54 domain-containing protein [Mycena venus]
MVRLDFTSLLPSLPPPPPPSSHQLQVVSVLCVPLPPLHLFPAWLMPPSIQGTTSGTASQSTACLLYVYVVKKFSGMEGPEDATHDHHAQTTASRLARPAAAQTQLVQRLLALAVHCHPLVPSLHEVEEELHVVLKSIGEQIGVQSGKHGGSNGCTQVMLGKLWALVGVLSAAKEAQ